MLICWGCLRPFRKGATVVSVMVHDRDEGSVIEHYHRKCAPKSSKGNSAEPLQKVLDSLEKTARPLVKSKSIDEKNKKTARGARSSTRPIPNTGKGGRKEEVT